MINKKHFLWPKWTEKGISRLIDIYSQNRTLKSINTLKNEFNINIDPLPWNQLLTSIPKDWKNY